MYPILTFDQFHADNDHNIVDGTDTNLSNLVRIVLFR